MKRQNQALVSIVTPVYNGERFLEECIESVMDQTYENWEYIIVNNASIDNSLHIAERYQKEDTRIRIYNNHEVLPMVKNWNHAVQQISAQSSYCKIVHADDLLFPDCIQKMVDLAENVRSVGIVGAYVLEGTRVKCDGLAYPSNITSGKEVCRNTLNQKYYLFGSPTSLLIRSDLIRKRNPFYQEKYLQVVDQEVCYYLLKNYDFGFVHDVLTHSRIHESSVTSTVTPLNRLMIEELTLLVEYGKYFMDEDSYLNCLNARLEKYYKYLGVSLLSNKNKEFWNFHKDSLRRIGFNLRKSKLIKEALHEIIRQTIILSAHPIRTLKSLRPQTN